MSNQEKRPRTGQVEKRSLGTTLAAAAVTGITSGAASAATLKALTKTDKADKPKKF